MSHLIQWDNEEKTVVFQQYTDNPVKDDLYYLTWVRDNALNLETSIGHEE